MTIDLAQNLERSDRDTIIRFGPMWVIQSLLNLPKILPVPFLRESSNHFRDKPAIIVSPGPSLEKNIADLIPLQGRALICAVTSAVTPLRKDGIEPDLVMVLDPQDLSYHFADLEKPLPAFLIGTSCAPPMWHVPSTHRIAYTPNGPYDQWFTNLFREQPNDIGAISVSITAAIVAAKWGCNPIVFVGQDCAVGESGNWYASGSPDGGAKINFHEDGMMDWDHSQGAIALAKSQGYAEKAEPQRVYEVPGYHGGMVKTFWNYMMNREILGKIATEHTEVEWLNATEGGASIEGTRQLRLQELNSQFTHTFSPAQIFEKEQRAVNLGARIRYVGRNLREVKMSLLNAMVAVRNKHSPRELIPVLKAASLMTFIYRYGKVWRSRNALDEATSTKLLYELVEEVHNEVVPLLDKLIEVCQKSPDELQAFAG